MPVRYSRRSCGQRISRCPGPSGLSTYILGGCLTRCFRQGITKELEEKECVRLWFGFVCYASGVATGISHYSCFISQCEDRRRLAGEDGAVGDGGGALFRDAYLSTYLR